MQVQYLMFLYSKMLWLFLLKHFKEVRTLTVLPTKNDAYYSGTNGGNVLGNCGFDDTHVEFGTQT